jgi:glycosyltransferase involved in cell wall biosynthesis
MSQAGHQEPTVASVTFVLGTTAGGTGRHVRSLAAGLTARGVGVIVAGPAATQRLLGFTGAGARFVPVEISDRPRPVRDLAAVTRLRRLLRPALGEPRGRGAQGGGQGDAQRGAQGRAERGAAHGRGLGIVHAHGLRAGALAALALGGVIFPGGRRGGRVLVVTLHNAPPAGGGMAGAVYGVLERIVARRANRVLCVSGDLAARMRRRGARSQGHAVVPAPPRPPVSAETARAVRAGLGAAGRPVVFACGRLAAQKGFGTLLDAAAVLRGRDPQPLVVVAGSGPLHTELARRIDPERLPLRLLGHRDDVAALLAAADVFVLPSRWEGQPLILQEALRAGAAIVATRTGGIPDLAGEDAAVLVPPGDPAALATALLRVLTEPGLARQLSAAAAERARTLPDEDAAVEAVLADYRSALGGCGAN